MRLNFKRLFNTISRLLSTYLPKIANQAYSFCSYLYKLYLDIYPFFIYIGTPLYNFIIFPSLKYFFYPLFKIFILLIFNCISFLFLTFLRSLFLFPRFLFKSFIFIIIKTIDFFIGFYKFFWFSCKAIDFLVLVFCDFIETFFHIIETKLFKYFEIFLFYFCEVVGDIMVYFINTFYLHFFIMIPFSIELYFWRLNDKICFFLIKSVTTPYLIKYYYNKPKVKKPTAKELTNNLVETFNRLYLNNELFIYSEEQIFLADLRVLKKLALDYYLKRGTIIFILHYHYYMIKVNIFYMIEICCKCIEDYFIHFHVPILIIGVQQVNLALIDGGWFSAAYEWIVKGHKACLYYYLRIMILPLLIFGPICRAFRIASKNHVQNDPFIHIMIFAREEEAYTLLSAWIHRMLDLVVLYDTTILSCFISTSTFWYYVGGAVPSFIAEYGADEPIFYLDDDEVEVLHAIHWWLYEKKFQSLRPTTNVQRPFWKEFFFHLILIIPSFFSSKYLDWKVWVYTEDAGNRLTLGPKFSRQQGSSTYRYKYFLPCIYDTLRWRSKYKAKLEYKQQQK